MPDWRQRARQIAVEEGIDPDLFDRQIAQESGYRTDAVSSAGARGIAQIVPRYHPNVDPSDPEASLRYAARWMKQLLAQYNGDQAKALAHYNGGGGAVQAMERGQPYGETRQYLSSILGRINPFAAQTAEAAELQQTGGQGQMDTPGTYKPGTPPVLTGQTFVPRTPGYRDDVMPDYDDATGRPTKRQRWTRTWDDGRIEIWTNDPTAPQTWTRSGNSQSKEAFDRWNVQVDNDRQQFVANSQAARQAGIGGAHFQKQQTTNAQGQPVIRTSVIQVDPSGQVTVVPIPQMDEPVQAGKKNYISGPRGELFEIDPQTGNLSVAVSAAPQVTTINGVAGTIDQSGSFKPILGAPGQPPTISISGGRVVVVNPQTGAIQSNTAIDPQADALDRQIKALELQKAQAALQPQRSLILQNRDALIQQLQSQYASGAITLEQANAYYDANEKYTLAAMQGSTPLQIEQERRQAEEGRRTAGTNILNQRVSTGGALANGLLNTASSLAQKAVFRPGQTSLGIDPMALARMFAVDTVNDLGGGAQVGDFAKGLVLGGAGAPAGLGASDAAGQFVPPWAQQPTTPGGNPLPVGVPGVAPLAPQAPMAPTSRDQWWRPPYPAPSTIGMQ